MADWFKTLMVAGSLTTVAGVGTLAGQTNPAPVSTGKTEVTTDLSTEIYLAVRLRVLNEAKAQQPENAEIARTFEEVRQQLAKAGLSASQLDEVGIESKARFDGMSAQERQNALQDALTQGVYDPTKDLSAMLAAGQIDSNNPAVTVVDSKQPTAPATSLHGYDSKAYGVEEQAAAQQQVQEKGIVLRNNDILDLSKKRYHKEMTFLIPAGVEARVDAAFLDAHRFKFPQGTATLGYEGENGNYALVAYSAQGKPLAILNLNNAKVSVDFARTQTNTYKNRNLSDAGQRSVGEAAEVLRGNRSLGDAAINAAEAFGKAFAGWLGNKNQWKNEWNDANPVRPEQLFIGTRVQGELSIPEIIPNYEAKKISQDQGLNEAKPKDDFTQGQGEQLADAAKTKFSDRIKEQYRLKALAKAKGEDVGRSV